MAITNRLLLFSPLERMIAWRYLRPRRKEGFVSVIALFSFLGILLGVATLIIVMSVMNGFRHDLLGRLLGYAGHVVVSSNTGRVTDYANMAARIARLPGVIESTPIIDAQVMALANRVQAPGQVRAMRLEDLQKHPLFAGKIIDGKVSDFAGERSIIIGYRMAQTLGVRVGEKIQLLTPAQGPDTETPFGRLEFRTVTFTVVGLFNVGMSELDRLIVLMPLPAAQGIFDYENSVSGIEVRLAQPDATRALSDEIDKLNLPGIRTRAWQQTYDTYFNALETERHVMFMILTLIIVVAAFNIISSLVMMVKDKTQAIAILRTMGATRSTIMRVFVLSGASIGVVGTLAGVGIGLLISYNVDTIKRWAEQAIGHDLFPAAIYFLSRLPSRVDVQQVIEIGLMGLCLSLLATIYPSWKAARLDPVEALRNE